VRAGGGTIGAEQALAQIHGGLFAGHRNRPGRTGLNTDTAAVGTLGRVEYGPAAKTVGQFRRQAVGVFHRSVALLESGENYLKHIWFLIRASDAVLLY